MAKDLYSKDLLSHVLVDRLGIPYDQIWVPKQKIVFGADGIYTDVTALTPFPVTGTFTPASPGFSSFGQGTPKKVTVTNTSTILLLENPARKAAYIINNTEQRIYIQYGIYAEWLAGFPLETNGTFPISNFGLFLGQINAITDDGSIDIDVIEGES